MSNGMRITFGEREIDFETYGEREQFERVLGETMVDSLMVGDDAEGRRMYYVVTIHSQMPARTQVRIGVAAALQGIAPKVLTRPATQELWIGFSDRVVVVDTTVPLIRHVFELDSVFYQFLPTRAGGVTLMVHETGVVAASDGCEIVWSAATDVIVGVQLTHADVRLELMDDDAMRLDVITGRPL